MLFYTDLSRVVDPKLHLFEVKLRSLMNIDVHLIFSKGFEIGSTCWYLEESTTIYNKFDFSVDLKFFYNIVEKNVKITFNIN